MNKRRVLLSIDWFLPGTNSGGPVRSYANLFESFKNECHFYVITRNIDYVSSVPYKNITANEWSNYNDYISVYYFSKNELNYKNLFIILNESFYDVIMINGIYSYYFSIIPSIICKSKKTHKIISPRGMLNPHTFVSKGLLKKIFLKIIGTNKLYNDYIFHATNKDESFNIKKYFGSKVKIQIAPNLPRRIKFNFLKKKSNNSNKNKFIYLARISPEKGTHHILNTLKNIKKTMFIDFYGAIYDEDYWMKCKGIISILPKNISISYKGILPSNDVPKTLSKYDYFVLFSEGENFGHSILEAMMVGVPVLISDKTPWNNLSSLKIGWNTSLKNNKNMIQIFNKALSMQNDNYRKWSNNAYNFSRKISDDKNILNQNKKLLNLK